MSEYLAAGGIFSMFGIVATLLITLVRLMLNENDRNKDDNEECTRRLNLVINCLNENGIKIPDAVWIRPPKPTQRRRRKQVAA